MPVLKGIVYRIDGTPLGTASQSVHWHVLDSNGNLQSGHANFPVQTYNDPPVNGKYTTPDVAANTDYLTHVNGCTAIQGYYCLAGFPNEDVNLWRVVAPNFTDAGTVRGLVKNDDGTGVLKRRRMKWEHQTEGWGAVTMCSGYGHYWVKLPAGTYDVYLDDRVFEPEGNWELSGSCEVVANETKTRNFRHPTVHVPDP